MLYPLFFVSILCYGAFGVERCQIWPLSTPNPPWIQWIHWLGTCVRSVAPLLSGTASVSMIKGFPPILLASTAYEQRLRSSLLKALLTASTLCNTCQPITRAKEQDIMPFLTCEGPRINVGTFYPNNRKSFCPSQPAASRHKIEKSKLYFALFGKFYK